MSLGIEAQEWLLIHFKILVDTSKLNNDTLLKILDLDIKEEVFLNDMDFEKFIEFLEYPSEPIELVGLGIPEFKEKMADLTIGKLFEKSPLNIAQFFINSQRAAYRAGIKYSYERNRNELLCNLYSLVDCPLVRSVRWKPAVLDKLKDFTKRAELENDCVGLVSLESLEILFFELNEYT